MSRYPSRNGIALPAQEIGYEVVPYQRGATSNHHLFYERTMYSGVRHRSVFRNLIPHVQTLLSSDHIDLHERFTFPVMPKDTRMIDVVEEYLALNGVINCVYEKKTNEVYEIHEEQWQSIKGLYRMAA